MKLISRLKAKRMFVTTPDYDVRIRLKNEDDIKYTLLKQSLTFVPSSGFSKDALVKGAESMGWTAASHGICQRGPIELVEYFVTTSTQKLQLGLKPEFKEYHSLTSLKTTAKIKSLVIDRLEMTKPFIQHWPQAVSLMVLPQNSMNTFEQLGELVDEMWFLAGDNSLDLNWYSKRMLLAGVYTSTGTN